MAQSTLTTVQQRAGLVAVALLAMAGLWTVWAFLPALGWGCIIAVSLWPWYQRQLAKNPRRGGLLLPAEVTLAVALAFILPMIMVVSALAHEVGFAAHYLSTAASDGLAPPAFLSGLPMGAKITAWWQASLAHPGGLNALARSRAEGGLPLADGGRVAGEVAHRLLIAVFTLLVLFFTLREGDAVARSLRAASNRAFGPVGERVGEQIVTAIRGTVNGLVIVGLGEGILLGIAYTIAGVPHPALFALLTALLSAVPLGASLAAYGAAALLAVQGDYVAAVAIAVFGTVVIFAADHFVRPVLIGEATRLPFLWVLLGILGGIEAWGLIGLVLGPALIAALMLLWREWTGAEEGPLNPPAETA